MGKKINKFKRREIYHVWFRDITHHDILFLLGHGYEDGRIYIGKNKCMDNVELLKKLLQKGTIRKMGIKKVITINCYGGYQKPITIDGVTIQSLHHCKDEVYMQCMQHLDNDLYDLIIDEKE